MKQQQPTILMPHGMTLVEVLVTITILGFVLASSLTLYSTVLKNIQLRDSMLTMIRDSDLIMTYIGDDLRMAKELLSNYPTNASQTVVAALKEEERIIVYAIDADRPNRLVRSVYAGQNSTSTELSTRINRLQILAKTPRLFQVDLLLEETVVGKHQTWQTASAFAARQ